MNYGDARLPERFWDRCTPEPNTGCWMWTGAVNDTGYGNFQATLGMRSTVRAHRHAYTTLIGPIGAGLVLDHRCRQPCCVNPAHLEPVTQAENVRRGVRIERTTCVNGHEYTPENTGARSDNQGKVCKTCRRAAMKRFKERRAQNAPHTHR